ncbi:MAG: site-specific integrase [Deltaproteobacteria bacterium]|nr:MAG: site-specific integrase [Deltaproteobacteria bacterium]
MGMIYKRGKKYWIKYYRNGKPYRESTKSTKEADAKRLLKKREGEISQGKLPGIYFDRVRFDELAEDLLTDYRINGKSMKRANASVGHLRGEFEGMRVTDIITPRIEAYIEKRLAAGAANATINRELAALKRMLNMGAEQTPPKVDKVPHIPLLKENNVRKGFFEHGEFLVLRDVLPDHLKGIATFGYKVGWRHEEICSLTRKQVDLRQGIVRLEPGEAKNDEARTVYLDEELKEVFRTEWNRRKKLGTALPYVFLNKKGTDRVKRFDKAWRTACKGAGIGRRLFHDFRRTAVRNMVRSGVPERVAMMISGHRSRSVFERYNIVSDADLKLAAQRQEAYLESVTGTVTGTVHDLEEKRGSSTVS